MKAVYLHTSDFNVAEILGQDPGFMPACEYMMTHSLTRHEYGRILGYGAVFHYLIGNIRDDGCPWCGKEPRLKEILTTHPYMRSFCLECTNCYSRGPGCSVRTDSLAENHVMDEMLKLMRMQYATRRQWDHKLKEEMRESEADHPEE